MGGLYAVLPPAHAQGIPFFRDDETEQLLKSYEDPLYRAGGLDPAALRMYLVNEDDINAEATDGQNILIFSGLFTQLDRPNEVIGVLAHETGHIVGGHLSRMQGAIDKASIPMLASLALGVAAMLVGAGSAGMGIFMAGQQVAQAQFNAFSRVQEGTADAIGQKLLLETHQSGQGMLDTFEQMADIEAMSAYHPDPWMLNHPSDRQRIENIQKMVDASPYRDVKDSPAAQYKFDMVKAKLAGFTESVPTVLNKYPPADDSDPGHYARAIAYMRQPNLPMALSEIKILIARHPDNPYFHQVLGQIDVDMARPALGVPEFQKAVDLNPKGGEVRVELAAAELATEDPKYSQRALDNLKAALQSEDDDVFAWYEVAQAYSQMGNEPMANLSTAERYYALGAYPQAAHFATVAQRGLTAGSQDWQRANDLMSAAGSEAKQ